MNSRNALLDICETVAEQRELKLVIHPSIFRTVFLPMAMGFAVATVAFFVKEYRDIVWGAGCLTAISTNLLSAQPTLKPVTDIIRNELTEPQKTELANSVRPIFGRYGLASINYRDMLSPQIKNKIEGIIQSFLRDKFGNIDFSSTLRND